MCSVKPAPQNVRNVLVRAWVNYVNSTTEYPPFVLKLFRIEYSRDFLVDQVDGSDEHDMQVTLDKTRDPDVFQARKRYPSVQI